MTRNKANSWKLRILENPEEMLKVEDLQRRVWPGTETEIVPMHMLVTFAKNGGLVIGAYEGAPDGEPDSDRPFLGAPSQESDDRPLVGFVFGFPGLYFTPDGPRPKHCSHQLAVSPDHRQRGIGFALKRAQWQMVRHQGMDLITWTFDPLQSRNAYLNIARLGGICSTYQRELYGNLNDELNKGLLTDRFLVDWWVNTRRVNRRLSRKARPMLDLAHYLSAGAEVMNPSYVGSNRLPRPADGWVDGSHGPMSSEVPLRLVEIPADYSTIQKTDPGLARHWRLHTRDIFENLFERGYLVTDFVYLPGSSARSYYVLSHGESTL